MLRRRTAVGIIDCTTFAPPRHPARAAPGESAQMVRRRFGLPLALVALTTALVIWGTVVEPQRLILRDEPVEVPAWPGTPLKVALVADLHAGAPFADVAQMREVAALVAAQAPDLVLMLGDYSINDIPGGTHVDPNEWASDFGAIAAPLGVFAVLGNHDWWNDTSSIRSALEAGGIRVLENMAVPLQSGAKTFWLVGIGDTFTGNDRVSQAFAAVPEGATVLAMSHGPDVTDQLADRASLVVAGHTHGGQIYIPFVSQALLNLRWRRGLYHPGGVPLYVTSGIGNSILPIRFGVPPEVVMLRVEPGP